MNRWWIDAGNGEPVDVQLVNGNKKLSIVRYFPTRQLAKVALRNGVRRDFPKSFIRMLNESEVAALREKERT